MALKLENVFSGIGVGSRKEQCDPGIERHATGIEEIGQNRLSSRDHPSQQRLNNAIEIRAGESYYPDGRATRCGGNCRNNVRFHRERSSPAQARA